MARRARRGRRVGVRRSERNNISYSNAAAVSNFSEFNVEKMVKMGSSELLRERIGDTNVIKYA